MYHLCRVISFNVIPYLMKMFGLKILFIKVMVELIVLKPEDLQLEQVVGVMS